MHEPMRPRSPGLRAVLSRETQRGNLTSVSQTGSISGGDLAELFSQGLPAIIANLAERTSRVAGREIPALDLSAQLDEFTRSVRDGSRLADLGVGIQRLSDFVCDWYYQIAALALSVRAPNSPIKHADLMNTRFIRAGGASLGGFSAFHADLLGFFPDHPWNHRLGPDRMSVQTWDLNDPNHPCVIKLAANSFFNLTAKVSTSEFLIQTATFLSLEEDPVARVACARAELGRMKATIWSVRPFGPDVAYAEVPTVNGPHYVYAYTAAESLGHEILVTYEYSYGAYGLKVLGPDKTGGLKSIHTDFDPTVIPYVPKSEITDDSRAFLRTRGEAAKFIAAMRAKGRWSFKSVSDLRPREIEANDRLDPERVTQFFAEAPHASAEILEVRDITLSASPHFNQRGNLSALVLTADPYPEFLEHPRKLEPPDARMVIGFRLEIPGKSERSLKNALPSQRAKAILWADGHRTLVLERGFLEPALMYSAFRPLIECMKDRPVWPKVIRMFQSTEHSHTFVPVWGDSVIPTCDRRFKNPPLKVRYETVSQIPKRVPLHLPPLAWGFDQDLQGRGYRKNVDGYNCLTNFKEISVPLVKPTKEELNGPLSHLAGLRWVPRKSWILMLQSMQGNRLRRLEDVVPLDLQELPPREDDDGVGDDKLSPPRIDSSKIGEMYDGPRRAISIVGRWFLFEVERTGGIAYIVDSPLHGDAGVIFGSLASATRAATVLSAATQPRLTVRNFTDYIGRVVHSEGWKDRVEVLLSESLGPAPENSHAAFA